LLSVFVQHVLNKKSEDVAIIAPIYGREVWFTMDNFATHFGSITVFERTMSHATVVQDNTKAPHVTLFIIRATNYFWSRTLGCAYTRSQDSASLEVARKAHVNKFEGRLSRRIMQHKIGRLNISVSKPVVVHICDG
jgi:hypothetical protein